MKTALLAAIVLCCVSACANGGGISGNEGGSAPLNEAESIQYQKALLKCYKTGGTRIVKIEGYLRCF